MFENVVYNWWNNLGRVRRYSPVGGMGCHSQLALCLMLWARSLCKPLATAPVPRLPAGCHVSHVMAMASSPLQSQAPKLNTSFSKLPWSPCFIMVLEK